MKISERRRWRPLKPKENASVPVIVLLLALSLPLCLIGCASGGRKEQPQITINVVGDAAPVRIKLGETFVAPVSGYFVSDELLMNEELLKEVDDL